MRSLRWAVLVTAAAILGWQLFVPQVVGLADQGDYARVIGRFGYGPADKSPPYYIAFVPRKFVPDPGFRVPDLEHVESEYLFAGAAVLVNKLFSKDGTLDIEVIGLVHALAFLAAFARLLTVTTGLRAAPFVWIASLLILADVGYVAYWNSFYSEPASCIFFLLLVSETITIIGSGEVSVASISRWSLWAVLFIGAKFQNFPFTLLLVPLAIRFGWQSKRRLARYVSIAGAAAILIVALINVSWFPKPLRTASTYNALFLGILPESKTPVADLAWFHMEPQLARYSGTGSWSPGTAFPDLFQRGILGRELTPASVARFWIAHPTRMWRRAKAVLPIAFSLRPEWCGNFERVAGKPPGARSMSFALWSTFHKQVITRVGKFLIVLLFSSPLAAIAAWIARPRERLLIECAAVLSVCCLMAFLIAICGDAWDTVKHLFLFNLILDTAVVSAATFVLSTIYRYKSHPGSAVSRGFGTLGIGSL